MVKDDTLWKGILENVFDDFLRFFFIDADSLFNIEKGFQFLDKELEQLFPTDKGTAPKFVDKLVKVYTKSGIEEWLLIHIEVQGYREKDFAKRMFQYFYRILDKYDRPVTALAIFTDDDKNFNPNVYEYDQLGTTNTFKFKTYKVIAQDEVVLSNSDNPFSIVILTVLLALKRKKLNNDDELFDLKYALAKNLFKKNIPKKKIDDLLIFLQLYVKFADSDYNTKFDKAIDLITENNNTMGIREQVLERATKDGVEKGKAEVVINLIEKMGLSDVQVADIVGVSIGFVEKVRSEMKK